MEGAAGRRRDRVAAAPAATATISRAAELLARGEPFVLATVVRRTAPSSARPGQKAVVLADGTLEGWLGGACIEPAIRREALRALGDGRARLVVFAPEDAARRREAAAHPDTVVHPMTCHSGGTVEIHVEPQLPPPVLALFGDSPVNRALAAMGRVAGYAVRAVDAGETVDPPAGERLRVFAVVATMGERDEDDAERALAAGAEYVGVVASPRRAAEIRRALRDRGVEEERLERLASPAGLDLGAVEPAEIAVTILAEVVQRRRAGSAGRTAASPVHEGDASRAASSASEDAAPGRVAPAREGPGTVVSAVDPVCGMEVEAERAGRTYEHEGTLYYFCCPRCRERFAREPERFVTA